MGGTHFALRAGLGLLVANKLSCNVRRGVPWAVGALATIPRVMGVLGKPQVERVQRVRLDTA